MANSTPMANPSVRPNMNPDEQQLESIWQVGSASLVHNNNELVLPEAMAAHLSVEMVEALKARLSHYLGGAITIAFLDPVAHVFRIRQMPDLSQAGVSPRSYPSSRFSTDSPASTTSDLGSRTSFKARPQLRKKAPPRPANSFILYRQKHHPILKKQNPDLHNNDISVILGKQWKSESAAVKAEYKNLAEKLKLKHAEQHPGYQYAPRKPSEKKRRMTARKLAHMHEAQDQQKFFSNLGIRMADAGDYDQDESEVEYTYADVSDHNANDPDAAMSLSVENVLGTQRSSSLNLLQPDHYGNVTTGLPNNNPILQGTIEAHNDSIHPSSVRLFDPANGGSLSTQLAPHVVNDQDFFDSLIDWEGIAEDAAFVRNASNEEHDELAEIEIGNPSLPLSIEVQRTAFQAELERTLKLFK